MFLFVRMHDEKTTTWQCGGIIASKLQSLILKVNTWSTCFINTQIRRCENQTCSRKRHCSFYGGQTLTRDLDTSRLLLRLSAGGIRWNPLGGQTHRESVPTLIACYSRRTGGCFSPECRSPWRCESVLMQPVSRVPLEKEYPMSIGTDRRDSGGGR